ncbi:MAG: SGNH/GDSL hydrolase family protein [Oscillospiraceae bacterium]|jgi:lysophospholipase L1-like esterase|nr:SGNH/GDSL hydrolase family protein [Oscillospiraceae bacterium]
MKNVLLLGDSIRMLYEPLVREQLRGRANVYAPEENGRWSGYTLNSLRFWIPNTAVDAPWNSGTLPTPDIVHWNNGIWDLGDDYALGQPFTAPAEYLSALDRTVTVLRKLCGEQVVIIMATATPTADSNVGQPHEYNEILKSIAANRGCEVNDLYSAIAADKARFISDDRVHLSSDGTAVAAKLVTAAIERWL